MNSRIRKNVENVTKQEITEIDHVHRFINSCFHRLKVNFHPDTSFEDYINSKVKSSFSIDEQKILNQRLDECFDVCSRDKKDIYAIALQEVNSRKTKRKGRGF